MTPIWVKRSEGNWVPGVLISTTVHGSSDGFVLVGWDDQPHPDWKYPAGSMALVSVMKSDVRLRRTQIPLLPDGAGK